ncbi:MAG: cytidine deaminase [Anaerolineaceae bacterium 4572_78]|nr:MAG: cytidine deaminase [Anaerolineaceae bacterium 4572_78]
MNKDWTFLIESARQARENAYAPYSNYKVGAALLTTEGEIYNGCNVENAAYRPTICAEQTAIVKAISEGEQKFKAIAVITENGGSPCGVCRQVLREFAPNLIVIVADTSGNHRIYQLAELLPDSFGPEELRT